MTVPFALPLAVLREVASNANGNVWREVDIAREAAMRIRSWPSYVYADRAVYCAAVKTAFVTHDRIDAAERALRQLVDVAAIAPWRITRSIYRFDPDLSAALSETDPAAEIPCEALLRLPEWSICIIGQGLDPENACVFATLGYDDRDEQSYLALLSIHPDESRSMVNLALVPGTTIASQLARNLTITRSLGVFSDVPDDSDLARIGNIVSRVIAHVLYLCSIEPDYIPPAPPTETKTKHARRFFSADRETVVDVGYRIGEFLRRSRTRYEHQSTRTGRGVRPHWRVAHWHHFWTGPRAQPTQRRLIVKWIPPTPVNISDDIEFDAQPVVVRTID